MARVADVNFPEQVDGDTFLTKRFNFFDSDGTTALDLTDVTPRAQIRKKSAQGKLVKTATVGDGLSWNNQASGQLDFGGFDITWGGAGEYYYDIQFTYTTSGNIRTYIKGIITVIDDVTSNA